ncbi:MAG TPA: cyclodeaminase/cyclohydrolase family protein [Thermoplasmata archaeon]|nr:cyclodeaminase/cyclohydrolase family protein [Thermoplasmata archaeon]
MEEFLDRLGARSPTPGGGSASALAGALGAALGEMVFHYSSRPGSSVSELAPVLTELGSIRREFLEAVDADADAYELVRTRRRAKTESPQDPAAVRGWFQALRQAAEVPLATARRADRAHQLLTHHRERVRPALTSDLVTALALLRAAREGALANVATNLDVLREAGEPVADLEAESARLGGAL